MATIKQFEDAINKHKQEGILPFDFTIDSMRCTNEGVILVYGHSDKHDRCVKWDTKGNACKSCGNQMDGIIYWDSNQGGPVYIRPLQFINAPEYNISL